MRNFGRKPVKGGNPPIERRVRETRTTITGVFGHAEAKADTAVVWRVRKVRNIEEVIRI